VDLRGLESPVECGAFGSVNESGGIRPRARAVCSADLSQREKEWLNPKEAGLFETRYRR